MFKTKLNILIIFSALIGNCYGMQSNENTANETAFVSARLICGMWEFMGSTRHDLQEEITRLNDQVEKMEETDPNKAILINQIESRKKQISDITAANDRMFDDLINMVNKSEPNQN